MLHALDLTRSVQTARTTWQAISKNDNETIECVPRGSAKAALHFDIGSKPRFGRAGGVSDPAWQSYLYRHRMRGSPQFACGAGGDESRASGPRVRQFCYDVSAPAGWRCF
jgi:hypothetical protein